MGTYNERDDATRRQAGPAGLWPAMPPRHGMSAPQETALGAFIHVDLTHPIQVG